VSAGATAAPLLPLIDIAAYFSRTHAASGVMGLLQLRETHDRGVRLSLGQPEPWLLARLEKLDGSSIVRFTGA